MLLGRDDFFARLPMYAANSSRKWRLTTMEKSDLSLSAYVQYVEDFRFLMNVSGRVHRLQENEITKSFVIGLKLDEFREEMYFRTFKTLDDIIREAREELSTFRDILEISDRIKKLEPKKDFSKDKDRKIFRQRFQI